MEKKGKVKANGSKELKELVKLMKDAIPLLKEMKESLKVVESHIKSNQ